MISGPDRCPVSSHIYRTSESKTDASGARSRSVIGSLYAATLERRGSGLILLGVLMLFGSMTAARIGATALMDVFNFVLSSVVLLWGITNRLESRTEARG